MKKTEQRYSKTALCKKPGRKDPICITALPFSNTQHRIAKRTIKSDVESDSFESLPDSSSEMTISHSCRFYARVFNLALNQEIEAACKPLPVTLRKRCIPSADFLPTTDNSTNYFSPIFNWCMWISLASLTEL